MQVTYDNLRAYALGYYHGRAIGHEYNAFENELESHLYKQGYDAGVTDYRDWDKPYKEAN